MGIDYVSKVNTLVDILRAHNTTTASPDLSGSLTSRIQIIEAAEPDATGQRHGSYPCVFVEIANASEAETQIGLYTTRRKDKTITYNLWGFYKKEGISKSQSVQLTDFYQLASNIESVFKAEATLSGTAIHVGVVDTDFTERRENNMIKVVRVQAQVRYFYI